MAKKKITLEVLADEMSKGFASVDAKIADTNTRMQKGFANVTGKLNKIDARMETGFAAVAEDIADIKRDMATKDQIVALHTQVNAIETDIRTMKQAKLESRVLDLEDEVFGTHRSKHPKHVPL